MTLPIILCLCCTSGRSVEVGGDVIGDMRFSRAELPSDPASLRGIVSSADKVSTDGKRVSKDTSPSGIDDEMPALGEVVFGKVVNELPNPVLDVVEVEATEFRGAMEIEDREAKESLKPDGALLLVTACLALQSEEAEPFGALKVSPKPEEDFEPDIAGIPKASSLPDGVVFGKVDGFTLSPVTCSCIRGSI